MSVSAKSSVVLPPSPAAAPEREETVTPGPALTATWGRGGLPVTSPLTRGVAWPPLLASGGNGGSGRGCWGRAQPASAVQAASHAERRQAATEPS